MSIKDKVLLVTNLIAGLAALILSSVAANMYFSYSGSLNLLGAVGGLITAVMLVIGMYQLAQGMKQSAMMRIALWICSVAVVLGVCIALTGLALNLIGAECIGFYSRPTSCTSSFSISIVGVLALLPVLATVMVIYFAIVLLAEIIRPTSK